MSAVNPNRPEKPEHIAQALEWEQDPAFKAWLAEQSTNWRDDATGVCE